MSLLVSIVIPVFNGERFLNLAIESCLNQSYRNLEIIIVNDCSTDNSQEIIDTYIAKDSRVKCFKNETNLKLPKSLNNGFSMAKGELFTWTSDDNEFRPNALEEMVKNLICQNYDLIYSGYERKYSNEENNVYVKPLSPNRLISKNSVGACFLYKSTLHQSLNGYDESKFLVEDYDFWLRAAEIGKLGSISQSLMDYRCHGNSLTSTRGTEIVSATLELRASFLSSPNYKISEKFKAVFISSIECMRVKLYKKAFINIFNIFRFLK